MMILPLSLCVARLVYNPSFRNYTDLLSSKLFGFKIYGLEVPLWSF